MTKVSGREVSSSTFEDVKQKGRKKDTSVKKSIGKRWPENPKVMNLSGGTPSETRAQEEAIQPAFMERGLKRKKSEKKMRRRG